MVKDVVQARYQFTAQTPTGERYRLVNINIENNIATYRKANGSYAYLELDKVLLLMTDTQGAKLVS